MTTPEHTIREWLHYIHYRAGKFQPLLRCYLDYDDLVTIGMVAAWRAHETFDPARGAALGAHVCQHVMWAMKTAYETAKLQRVGLREMQTAHSIHPREEDDWMGIDVTDPSPLASEALDEARRAYEARRALRRLGDQEREVITLRYFGELEPVEVASRLGVSRQRVHQVERAAIGRLKASGLARRLA